jgi:hypothetical protein
LVLCDDLNNYVCKHSKGIKTCYTLFAEFLANAFLRELKIELPAHSFIDIKMEHINPSSTCQPAFFQNIDCFGTMHLKEALEFSNFTFGKSEIKKLINPMDLFTIAWFDIWTANEDRNFNNFNLLLNPEKKGWRIIPIDHGACFNSLSFNMTRPLELISQNESLIDTEPYKLLGLKYFKKLSDVDDFINSLYICVLQCEKRFDEIVSHTPKNWAIADGYMSLLKKNLFSKAWLEETKIQFLTLNNASLRIK